LILSLIFVVVLSIPIWGYFILNNTKINPSLFGWLLAIVFIFLITAYVNTTPMLMMLLYILSTFLSFKIVVANNHLKNKQPLNFIQWCFFCYAWFGMNPLPFLQFPSKALSDYKYYFIKGAIRICIGFIIINGMYFIFSKINETHFNWLLQLSYLVGLSFILHFGLLNMATGFLRMIGIPVTSLFKDPIKSTSLQEFWSKRWNIAFVELTTIAVLRPLKNRFGQQIAFWSSYLFSGLLHEMAISLPVMSGFGKPFIYFIIQAFLILTIEKHFIITLKNKVLKTIWLLCALLIPIFLLFHDAFIQKIIIPLVEMFVLFKK
jgi:Membrane bound O-acyl transferase family